MRSGREQAHVRASIVECSKESRRGALGAHPRDAAREEEQRGREEEEG